MARLSHSVVACFSLDGKLIKVYPSAKKAAKNRHLYPRTIDRCIRGDITTVKGLQWKRFNIDEVPEWIEPLEIKQVKTKARPLAKIDEKGNIVETYPSLKNAALINNIDPHTLRDRISGKYASKNKDKFRELTDEEIIRFGY